METETAAPGGDVCAWEALDARRLRRGVAERLAAGVEQTRWGDATLLWARADGAEAPANSPRSVSTAASSTTTPATPTTTTTTLGSPGSPRSPNRTPVTNAWTQGALEDAEASEPFQFVLAGQDLEATAHARGKLVDQILQRCMRAGEEGSRRARRLRKNLALADTLLDSLRLPDAGPPLVRRLGFLVEDSVIVHAVTEIPLLDLSRIWEFDIFVQLAGADRVAQQYPRCVVDDARRSSLEQEDPMAVEQRFATTLDTLEYFGVSGEELTGLLRILRAVLELGHAQGADPDADGRLDAASKLLGLPERLDVAARGATDSSSDVSDRSAARGADRAQGARDALAEALFDAVFRWVLARVNRALMDDLGERKKFDHTCNISVAEMPPLLVPREPVRHASVLLRNAACETVHLMAAKLVRQAEVASQCLLREVVDEDLARAQDVVDAVEGVILDLRRSGRRPPVQYERKGVSVDHYAGTVAYDVEAIESLDVDDVLEDLSHESGNAFVRKIMDPSVSQLRSSAIKRYRMGLEKLMSPFRKGKMYFIHCLGAGRLDAALREAGLAQLATLRSEACFPLRKSWEVILRMLPQGTRARLGSRIDRAHLRLELEDRLGELTSEPFHVGKKSVFFVPASWEAFRRSLEIETCLQDVAASPTGRRSSLLRQTDRPGWETSSFGRGKMASPSRDSDAGPYALDLYRAAEPNLSDVDFSRTSLSTHKSRLEKERAARTITRFMRRVRHRGVASCAAQDTPSTSQVSIWASKLRTQHRAALAIQRTWRMWSSMRRYAGLQTRRRRWISHLRADEGVVITSLVVKTVEVLGGRKRQQQQQQPERRSSGLSLRSSRTTSVENTSEGNGRVVSTLDTVRDENVYRPSLHAQHHRRRSLKSRKVRQLIYTTGPYPRLFYVDPFSGEFKGDIAWEEGVTRAVATSNTDFVVYSIPDPFKGKSEWHFSVLPSTNDAFAHDWVRALQRSFTVAQLFALPRGVFEYTPLQRTLCRGQLLKRSSLARASWNERYFVLRAGSLEWFRRRGDVDSRGFIVIDQHTGVYASKERFSFEITSPALSKPLRLRARSNKDLFYWVNGMTMAIHAAHDNLDLNSAPSSPKHVPYWTASDPLRSATGPFSSESTALND